MNRRLKHVLSNLVNKGSTYTYDQFIDNINLATSLVMSIDYRKIDDNCYEIVEITDEVTRGILAAYDVFNKLKYECNASSNAAIVNSVTDLLYSFMSKKYVTALNELEIPLEHFGTILTTLGRLASSPHRSDIRLEFHSWKFISQILASLHAQIKEAFLEDFNSSTDSPASDEFIHCLLLSIKRLFDECIADTQQSPVVEGHDEPSWRTKLKLIAFLCRLMVGCIQQFQSVLFLTNGHCYHRRVVDFISWTVEIQYAGGLFASGAGLEEAFAREISMSLFAAADVALSCLSKIGVQSEDGVSAAASAIIQANLTPLVNCRILTGILVSISNSNDQSTFSNWLTDNFNAYEVIFSNLDDAFVTWKPHECTPNLLDFHIPRVINYNPDQKALSSAVEEFLTTVTVDISRSVRNLPEEVFNFLESALLDTVLHASPVISIIAQDVWCFVVRYGSADLCWQYVTLLGNVLLGLAERYSSTEVGSSTAKGTPPPLEQMSRLGCLLSRFVVFLTARQQREFLAEFPLFDSAGGRTTGKAVVWRFLALGRCASQLQPSVLPLLEQQIRDQAAALLRSTPGQPRSLAWLLDALTCLRMAEDLSASAIAPQASVLSHLCGAVLSFDESASQDSEAPEATYNAAVAPPQLLHRLGPGTRLETLLTLLARWLPRRILLLASGQPQSAFEKLLKALLTQMRTCCCNGLSLPTMDTLSAWLRACEGNVEESGKLSTVVPDTPLSAFMLESCPASPSRSPLSSSVGQILASLWSPLCQTELNTSCAVTREVARRLKSKLQSLCPDIVKFGKRAAATESDENMVDIALPPTTIATVDMHLASLSEIVEELEQSSSTFTSAHRSRGWSLACRLSSLFGSSI